MASDLLLRARLTLDPKGWGGGLQTAQSSLRTFASSARRELHGLRSFAQSTAGTLATVGAGFTLASVVRESAMLDKNLNRLGNTTNSSALQMAGLRTDLHRMAAETGNGVEDLRLGVTSLAASGLGLKESRNSISAINRAMAVTGASADTLAGAMTVASSAFGFDLKDAKQAESILDKMAVAADLASAEIESLGSIFSRVGVSAQSAGFDVNQTLALVETLSTFEKNSDRLGTLTDSTLRVFTNQQYMRDAQKASGVKFFDDKGMRRDPLKVLDDLKAKMDKMKTDAQRESFLAAMLGGADLDTIRGFRMLTTGDSMQQMRTFADRIGNATGRIESRLPGALANSVNQAGRLQAVLYKTADGFAQKLNAGITTGIKKLLDTKEQGGLGLSGGELIGGAGALTLGAYAGGKMLKGAAGKLLGGTAGLATGVAMGSALEQAGAATPVFVVGAAPGVLGGGGGAVGSGAAGLAGAGGGGMLATMGKRWGARALMIGGSSVFGYGSLLGTVGPGGAVGGAGLGGAAATVGGVGLAGAAGWGVGTLAHKAITSNRYTNAAFEFGSRPGMETLMRTLAFLGNKEAKGIVADRERQRAQKMEAVFRVEASPELRAALVRAQSDGGSVRAVTALPPTGRMMQGSGR